MGKIITVSNQKGGTAKTVSCQHLAYALAESGKRVLTVDLDPQINLTTTLAINEEGLPELNIGDLFSLLLKDGPLPDPVHFIAAHGSVDFIQGSKDLSKIESLLHTEMGTERFLECILTPLRPSYAFRRKYAITRKMDEPKSMRCKKRSIHMFCKISWNTPFGDRVPS